jgi:iron complex outermembrane receptor protein
MRLFAGAALAFSTLGYAGAALAQAATTQAATTVAQGPAASPPEAVIEEIVVTGTLIRGVAPVGTQVVAVTQEDIVRTGAASGNNLLASMPLVSTFNTIAATPVDLGNNANRPNIRGLQIDRFAPSTTLLLMDGHNMVGASILQTTPDPTMIAPGAIQRVEVVPDGGSSLYGSDAVSGIVNFITRKQFDGTEVSAHYGFSDPYKSADFGITHGINWEGGSAVLSYFSRWNSPLFARDREFPRMDLREYGGTDQRSRNCSPGTVTVGSTTYALPAGTPTFTGLTPNTFNLCDIERDQVISPKEQQHSFFAAMQQELAPNLHFETTAYYVSRITKSYEPQLNVAGAVIDPSNPFFRPINGGTETRQTVNFSYAPVASANFQSQSRMRSYGFSPELTWQVNEDWELEGLFNYGWSELILRDPMRNAAAETAALRQAPGSGITLTTATALNPYDITQTSQAVIQNILNWQNYAAARQSITQGRLVANGTLLNLAGGDVRVAVGAQFSREWYNSLNGFAPVGLETGVQRKDETRNVYAVFGEVLVPIVGEANARPGIRSLSLDLSARFDKYENCCETSNPKIGVTYEPFEGLSVRGNWGTSFNAPSMADTGGAVDTRVNVGLTTPVANLRPGSPTAAVDQLRPSLSVPGGSADLQPQEATTWSIGVDINPVQVPGLRVGVTYWNVELRKMIGTSTMPIQDLYVTPAWQQYYILYPTLEQVLAFAGGTANLPVNGAVSLASLYGQGNDPYIIRDLRRHNLGNQYVDGIDWEVSYRRPTDFGSVRGSVNATYTLNRDSEPFEGAPLVDLLANNNRKLTLSANVGVEVGRFLASATLNYSGGYPVVGVVNQTRVKAFHPLNLFFRYGFDGPGLLRDTELTLNIDNVFDINPPFYNGGIGGGLFGLANGSTLGRYYNVGLRKRF